MTSAYLTADEFTELGDRAAGRLYRILGAQAAEGEGGAGYRFAVVAPNAGRVSVLGEFNGWNPERHPMAASDRGVWQRFIPGIEPGTGYKYRVVSRDGRYSADKADPFAFATLVPPGTGG